MKIWKAVIIQTVFISLKICCFSINSFFIVSFCFFFSKLSLLLLGAAVVNIWLVSSVIQTPLMLFRHYGMCIRIWAPVSVCVCVSVCLYIGVSAISVCAAYLKAAVGQISHKCPFVWWLDLVVCWVAAAAAVAALAISQLVFINWTIEIAALFAALYADIRIDFRT